jgi:hypothetical protein
MTVAAAAACTDDALPADQAAADAYQTWRFHIRQHLLTMAG